MRLQCRDPECPSRGEGELPSFSISVTVSEDREVSDGLGKVGAEYFTCNYCEDRAEDAQEEGEE